MPSPGRMRSARPTAWTRSGMEPRTSAQKTESHSLVSTPSPSTRTLPRKALSATWSAANASSTRRRCTAECRPHSQSAQTVGGYTGSAVPAAVRARRVPRRVPLAACSRSATAGSPAAKASASRVRWWKTSVRRNPWSAAAFTSAACSAASRTPRTASERPSAPTSTAAWNEGSLTSTHTTRYGAQILRSMASARVRVWQREPNGPSGSSSMDATRVPRPRAPPSWPSSPSSGSSPSCHTRGVAVMYSRRTDGIRVLSCTTAHGLPIRPDVRCASSTTIRSQPGSPARWARSMVPSPSEAYVANTVTRSTGRAPQRASSAGSVVVGRPASSPRSEHTAKARPVRPPSRQAAAVCTSRSREGTSTSTRPARSSSAEPTATRDLPEPVAMITWVRSPAPGTRPPAGSSSARTTASTASRWCGRSSFLAVRATPTPPVIC